MDKGTEALRAELNRKAGEVMSLRTEIAELEKKLIDLKYETTQLWLKINGQLNNKEN